MSTNVSAECLFGFGNLDENSEAEGGSAPTAGASGQSSDKMPAFAVNAATFGADFVVQESV